jgi:CSLREA domain-containing protein
VATYTVTTTGDTVDPSDGVLSLREALALADADGATADRVEFAPDVQGQTLVLAGSQLTVASDITIDGGSGVTLDADEKSRVLLVQSGNETDPNDITLARLTITGGRTTGDGEAAGASVPRATRR